MAGEGDKSADSFIRTLMKEVKAHPVVGRKELTVEELDGPSDLVHKLMSAVFPWATIDRHIAAAIVPFELAPFYTTPAWDELDLLAFFSPETNPACPMTQTEMTEARTMKAYHLILERLYGAGSDFNLPFVVGRRQPENGLERFFQIEIDPRFVQVSVKGGKPRLKEETIRELLHDPTNLKLWREHLPPERFVFSGFGLVRAIEVTNQQILSLIKNDLLDHRDFTADAGLDVLQGHIRSLLGKPDLELGILALESQCVADLGNSRVVGRSLVLSENALPECSKTHVSAYARAIEYGEPVFVQDLDHSEAMTGLEWHVQQMGFRSLAVFPLRESNRVVGLLELVSREAENLTPRSAMRLADVTPLLATALNRTLEERENRIQSFIKRNYTAIHPIVEWRFRRAALEQMDARTPVPIGPIVFEDVYPLYGLSDIRHSSTLRADAIQDDLTEQLGLALAVIIEASSIKAQPALDELGFRLGRQIDELRGEMLAGEESEPMRLLREEVEPLFDALAQLGPTVAKRVEEYRDSIDPELGMVYRKRRDFEVALTLINDRLSRFLDAREEVAQGLTTHYFEKYRTDGIDYNIYAGAALREDGQFDDLDLRNLRLWQLMTMAGCVWEMEQLKPDLPLALEVAHLILVQSNPLSIRFRPDEKKFDVDGAYNIRYEIVKKRIDKAEIRGTGERLTQAGKIAIAYSLASEQREYLRYLEYLQGAGYLEPGVEMLELEPLQGVHGLRAMRVTVARTQPSDDFLVEVLPATVALTRD